MSALLPRADRGDCGFTLIEVLVSMLIVSIGLIGLARLQMTSLQFNTSAYYRTQATALTYNLVERMRANREGALGDLYNSAFDDPAPACDTFAAGGGGTPALDLAAWRNTVACRLPAGTGAVLRDGTQFTIIVQWDDSRGADPPLRFAFTTAL